MNQRLLRRRKRIQQLFENRLMPCDVAKSFIFEREIIICLN
jgi:hypothetical protein